MTGHRPRSKPSTWSKRPLSRPSKNCVLRGDLRTLRMAAFDRSSRPAPIPRGAHAGKLTCPGMRYSIASWSVTEAPTASTKGNKCGTPPTRDGRWVSLTCSAQGSATIGETSPACPWNFSSKRRVKKGSNKSVQNTPGSTRTGGQHNRSPRDPPPEEVADPASALPEAAENYVYAGTEVAQDGTLLGGLSTNGKRSGRKPHVPYRETK